MVLGNRNRIKGIFDICQEKKYEWRRKKIETFVDNNDKEGGGGRK